MKFRFLRRQSHIQRSPRSEGESDMQDDLVDRIRAAIEAIGVEERWFHVLLAHASTTSNVAQHLQRAFQAVDVIDISVYDNLDANSAKRKSLIVCGTYDEMCLQYQRLCLRGKDRSFRPPSTTAILTPVLGERSDLITCYLTDHHGAEISKMTLAEFFAGYHSCIIVS